MKIVRWNLCVVALIVLTGCVSRPVAPTTSSGAKIDLVLLSDRGDEKKMEAVQWRYRNEVGTYMETDLLRRLNNVGYNATQVQKKKEYTPAADRYLIVTQIKSYNPGSSAARILVGYGAGACSLDVHYTIYDSNSKVVAEWDDGIGTSGDWRRLPVSLNNKLVARLNTELAAK